MLSHKIYSLYNRKDETHYALRTALSDKHILFELWNDLNNTLAEPFYWYLPQDYNLYCHGEFDTVEGYITINVHPSSPSNKDQEDDRAFSESRFVMNLRHLKNGPCPPSPNENTDLDE